MSTRQDILDAFEARMGTILTTGGYNTNAGQNVFTQKVTPLNDSEMPAIVIFDGERVEAITFGEELHVLELELNLVAAGDTADDIARQIAEDVITAIDTDDTFGGLAEDVVLDREDEIVMQPAEQLYGGSLMKLEIEYTTTLRGS